MPYNQYPRLLSNMSPVRHVDLVTTSPATATVAPTALDVAIWSAPSGLGRTIAARRRWVEYVGYAENHRGQYQLQYDPLLMIGVLTSIRR